MKKMKWEVTIAEVENGYVARVGCKLFVFPNWFALEKELTAYAHGEKTQLSEQIKKVLRQDETCETAAPRQADSNLADCLARG
jgi:hypothetical protein